MKKSTADSSAKNSMSYSSEVVFEENIGEVPTKCEATKVESSVEKIRRDSFSPVDIPSSETEVEPPAVLELSGENAEFSQGNDSDSITLSQEVVGIIELVSDDEEPVIVPDRKSGRQANFQVSIYGTSVFSNKLSIKVLLFSK